MMRREYDPHLIPAVPDWGRYLPDDRRRLFALTRAQLLRGVIVGEAEGESVLGQYAVGCVIRNRVESPDWWGDDFHDVILLRAQFSCLWADWPRRVDAILNAAQFAVPRSADLAAREVLSGEIDVTDGATHYVAHGVTPPWLAAMIHTASIGRHDFYRP